MTTEVSEKVIEIVCENLGVNKQDVTMDSYIIDDLGADSLSVVEIVMALEDAFDCLINDEQIEKFNTVGDVVDWLEKNIGETR